MRRMALARTSETEWAEEPASATDGRSPPKSNFLTVEETGWNSGDQND